MHFSYRLSESEYRLFFEACSFYWGHICGFTWVYFFKHLTNIDIVGVRRDAHISNTSFRFWSLFLYKYRLTSETDLLRGPLTLKVH